MPRFVILEHDHPNLHWDFMLESGATLRTWRLAAPPRSGEACPALELPDHRPFYLDYEGPVSEDRGTVTRWDAGAFEWATELPDHVAVSLCGSRLFGQAVLERTGEKNWSFCWNRQP
jgi:hypothetical protein